MSELRMFHLVLFAAAAPAAGAQLSFSDQSAAAGVLSPSTHTGANDAFPGDEMFEFMNAGFAIGDFDRNGYPDIYQPAGGLRRDKLFLNQGDGTFANRAKAWGVATAFQANAACAGDFDGDGWLDVFVISHGPPFNPGPGDHKLYRNLSGQGFLDVAPQAGLTTNGIGYTDGHSCAFGDYDLDGDLDLFVGGWRVQPVPNLGSNLFRNNGDGTFTDVSAAAGVLDPDLRAFSATFADVNGDRYPELLVAADFRSSRYFVNNQDGTFTDSTLPSGTGLDSNGMGSFVADIDQDGLQDWYVTSIFVGPNDLQDGNKLYLNLGNDTFMEVAESVGLDDGAWGWGTVAVDFDNDGDLDIAETNGWPAIPWTGVNSKLWLNDGTATSFSESAISLGIQHAVQGRGCVNLDYDLDGDQDLLLTANKGLMRLFRNDLVHGSGTNWIRIELDTSARPDLAPDGFGSCVTVAAAGKTWTRILDGACHYQGNAELALHFGLGSAKLVDTVTVLWNDGTTTVKGPGPVNRIVSLAAPAP